MRDLILQLSKSSIYSTKPLQFSIKNLPRKLLCSQEVSNGQETFYEETPGAAGNEKKCCCCF
ncbi:hypothetical protein FD828_27075 [Klebsiella pneumoniae]|nr:hypothetical protein [Klebsiella pneumoniae]